MKSECRITVEWDEEKGATRLKLHEGPFPCTREGLKAYNEMSNGWGHELLAMRVYLEYGIDPRKPPE